MKLAVVSGFLIAAALAACSDVPGAGPASLGAVTGGGKAAGAILYDVVKVNDHVASVLRAAPRPSFRTAFTRQGKPPPPRIAVGDRLRVVIWEAGPGGLFTAPLPAPVAPPAPSLIKPPEQPPTSTPRQKAKPGNNSLEQLFGIPPANETAPAQPPTESGQAPQTPQAQQPVTAGNGAEAALVSQENQQGVVLPAQVVARNGTITVPYAGLIAAAGHTPAEVQREIEARLAKKALEPQVLVIDEGGPAHTVTVTGAVVHGARVPLSPAGERLLQVIAEAGGARAPVHELFIRLSRGGITATLPLATLVAHPAENIYAWPGDVLTLIRLPQTFSVFGAAKLNAQIPFGAATLTLSKALSKVHGLNGELANPRGVFVFRYEKDSIVRALGEPLAATAQDGVSPIVYRFNLKDPKYLFLAQHFRMRNRDIVFVVDSSFMPIYRWFKIVSKFTGPIEEGFVVCYTTAGC
jgi:polysaccharide export outer membrane protein